MQARLHVHALVVLILADDLGFSDTTPYGGEVPIPAISELAEQGVTFTNYHTAASCAPTRGMMLTGVDSHLNGVPNIPEAIPPVQSKQSARSRTAAILVRSRSFGRCCSHRPRFRDILAYDFDVFLGGHLTQLGDRADVELTQRYVRDVYETTKRVHDSADMMAVTARTAQADGGWANKHLFF